MPLCLEGKVGIGTNLSCPGICNLMDVWFSRLIKTPCYSPADLLFTPVRFDEVVLRIGGSRMTAPPMEYQLEAVRIDAFPIVINHTTTLAASIPGFWAGLNDGIRPVVTQETTTTVVLDREGFVWKLFEPSNAVMMSTAEIAWLAKPLGGELALHRQLQANQDLPPEAKKNCFGTPGMFPLWIFFSGADMGAQISCYNNNYDLPPAVRRYQGVNARFDRPVCVLSFELYQPRLIGSMNSTVRSDFWFLQQQYGVRLKSVGSSGQFRAFHPGSMVMRVVAMLVLLRIPGGVVEFIALYCLGQLSVIYSKATIHNCHIKEQCGAAAVRVLQHASNFLQLADVRVSDEESSLAISSEKLHEHLSMAFRCTDILDQKEVAGLASFICKVLTQHTSSTHLIGMESYQKVCLLNQDIDFFDLAMLFDSERRKCPGELFFAPPLLRKEWQLVMESRGADLRLKTGGDMQNKLAEGTHQAQTQLNGQQENSDTMLQMLAEELQFVRSEMGKMMSKVELLENQVKRLNGSRETEMGRASSIAGDETNAAGSSHVVCSYHRYI